MNAQPTDRQRRLLGHFDSMPCFNCESGPWIDMSSLRSIAPPTVHGNTIKSCVRRGWLDERCWYDGARFVAWMARITVVGRAAIRRIALEGVENQGGRR